MYWNSFVLACTQIFKPMETVFNTKNTIANLNNVCKFQEIAKNVTRTKVRNAERLIKNNFYFS